uniref:Uncharacterized protein LOC102800906 n=1 Tax=Saccoglossus kowalevskii TaxID=10224 RepID=A0ABM0M000_SACKO|nr:PREDICTED: uncharacterized protein LOC102800906 [Saccoglossus kowalevskii]
MWKICKQLGHTERICENRKCFKCGENGHIARHCYNSVRDFTEKKAVVGEFESNEENNGTPMKTSLKRTNDTGDENARKPDNEYDSDGMDETEDLGFENAEEAADCSRPDLASHNLHLSDNETTVKDDQRKRVTKKQSNKSKLSTTVKRQHDSSTENEAGTPQSHRRKK